MLLKFLKPEISELVETKDWKVLKEVLSDWPTPDIADLIENIEEKDSVILFRLLSKEMASDVFSELEPPSQEILIKSFGNTELKQLILDLSPDDRTELFDDLPAEFTQKILNLLPAEERKEALQLLCYPEDSVGRLMTPDFVAVRQEWSIDKSIQHIRKLGKDAETINMIYVTDGKWRLMDDIPIRRFILANFEQTVADLMDEKFIALAATEDQEQAYHLMKHYDLNVLPLIDSAGVLLGIVTIDDIIDILEEEITEDFHKVAAISPVEENYVVASPFLLYRKRVGWLLLLLVANFVSTQ